MHRTTIRMMTAALALGALAACSKRNANTDETTTGSEGGMTPNAPGAPAAPASSNRANRGNVPATKSGGLFGSNRHNFTLPSGTALSATSEQTISSRTTRVGARVLAKADQTIFSASGDTVIPAGAEFIGHVTAIHPAPEPGKSGTLQLAFDSVSMGNEVMPVELKITSVSTTSRGRGVTTTDAAKVGAGAVIGGIAGRILGHNAKGTIIGAAAGAAAGGVVAHNTRTIDIVLPQGSAIRMELTGDFDRSGAITSR